MKITTQEIEYRVNDTVYIGYLATDTTESTLKPAVLIAPEWWGRNDYAKSRADQLAKDGFIAFAIDLYGNAEVAATPERAGQLMNAARNTNGAIEACFDAAYATLLQQTNVTPNNVSIIGYCFGGAVALEMARKGKNLKLVASFHGTLQTNSPLQAAAFRGQILVFNGAADPMVTPDALLEFKSEMDNAKANYKIVNYPSVLHGFSNPAATAKGKAMGMPLAYDQHADHDSYQQTIAALNAG